VAPDEWSNQMFADLHNEVARWCLAGITRIFRSLLWYSRPFLSQNAPNCEKVEAGVSRSQTTLSFDDET